MTKPVLSVQSLSKRFRRGGGSIVRAVDDVSLDVGAGEVLVLLGPSGCGKTTLLRCIAGLESPDTGRIDIRGQAVFDSERALKVPTVKRRLSMIFQSYALWSHMTVFDNVAYPLRARREPKREINGRVLGALEMVGISELRGQYPSQMSGGQQQRVALARALVSNDELILFDEPLSNVDARVREQLRFELAEMQQRLRFAAVYVTHDQIEALSLADRIAVMRGGSVQQIGTPQQIYSEPNSRYVSNFVGASNELVGSVSEILSETVVRVDTTIGPIEAKAGAPIAIGDEAIVTFRPEHCSLHRDAIAEPGSWPATIEASMFLGSHTEYLVRIDGIKLKVWTTTETLFAPGDQCRLAVTPSALWALRA